MKRRSHRTVTIANRGKAQWLERLVQDRNSLGSSLSQAVQTSFTLRGPIKYGCLVPGQNDKKDYQKFVESSKHNLNIRTCRGFGSCGITNPLSSAGSKRGSTGFDRGRHDGRFNDSITSRQISYDSSSF